MNFKRVANQATRVFAPGNVGWIVWMGCLALSGCGSEYQYDTIATQPVHGKIIINDVPAEGALIRFHPDSPQAGAEYPLMPSAKANEEGVFELTTYEGPDGAPVGQYTVTVQWPDRQWRPADGSMPPPPPDRLMGKYADAQTSEIHYTVVQGENDVPPIVLENVPLLKGTTLP